jgi:hypothetical protein
LEIVNATARPGPGSFATWHKVTTGATTAHIEILHAEIFGGRIIVLALAIAITSLERYSVSSNDVYFLAAEVGHCALSCLAGRTASRSRSHDAQELKAWNWCA